jgi:hypothetical protein
MIYWQTAVQYTIARWALGTPQDSRLQGHLAPVDLGSADGSIPRAEGPIKHRLFDDIHTGTYCQIGCGMGKALLEVSGRLA